MSSRPMPTTSQSGPPNKSARAVPQKAPPAIHPNCVPFSPNCSLKSLIVPPRIANARAVTTNAVQLAANNRPLAGRVFKRNLLDRLRCASPVIIGELSRYEDQLARTLYLLSVELETLTPRQIQPVVGQQRVGFLVLLVHHFVSVAGWSDASQNVA